MKTTRSGLKVTTGTKAAGIGYNHNRAALKVKSAVKAAGIGYNHNRTALKIRTSVRAGMTFSQNHSRRLLCR